MALDEILHHIWNEHTNASFFNEANIIIVSLWFTIGYRCSKLIFSILARWITKTKRWLGNCIVKASKHPAWIHYKRRKNRECRKKYKWHRLAFTSAFNVDDKVKQSNENCLFDTDADFVVCDNSDNNHICNNKDMFVDFIDDG